MARKTSNAIEILKKRYINNPERLASYLEEKCKEQKKKIAQLEADRDKLILEYKSVQLERDALQRNEKSLEKQLTLKCGDCKAVPNALKLEKELAAKDKTIAEQKELIEEAGCQNIEHLKELQARREHIAEFEKELAEARASMELVAKQISYFESCWARRAVRELRTHAHGESIVRTLKIAVELIELLAGYYKNGWQCDEEEGASRFEKTDELLKRFREATNA